MMVNGKCFATNYIPSFDTATTMYAVSYYRDSYGHNNHFFNRYLWYAYHELGLIVSAMDTEVNKAKIFLLWSL